MASGSNSTVITTPNGGKFNLLISWNENSTSTENNTSNITVTAKLTKNNARFDVNNAGVLKAYWHDDKTNSDTEFASLAVTELGYNSTERVASGTKNMTHKDDGTLNGYAYASWTRNSTYGGYVPKSGTCSTGWGALTTIARASQPSINTWPDNSPNFNIGDTITIHMNRKSPSFTHTVKINYGSTSYTIATGVTDNCSLDTSTIASQLYAQIPSGTSYSNTISVTTYNGSTNIGTKTCAYTAKAVEANVKPTFSNFTFRDGNSTTTAITGNNQWIIQNKSSLIAEISTANKAVARMSATMSSYVFEISSYSGTEAYTTSAITKTIGAVNATANQNLKVTAKDSRGYSTAVNKTVNIVPYATPVLNVSAARLNNFENNTTIKISGTVSLLKVNNVVKNAVNATSGVQYRYKSQSTSTWGSWTNVASSMNQSTGAITTSDFVLSLNNTQAWDFEIKLTDRLETKTVSIVVSQGQPQFFIGADGRTAVGGVPSISKPSGNLGQLEVYGNVYSKGKKLMTLDEIYPVGSIFMSATHSTAQAVATALGGGTWVAWGAGRVPVGVDTSQTEFKTVGKTGGEKTHKLTVDEMPSHHHALGQDWADWKLQTGGGGPRGIYVGYAYSTDSKDTGGDGAHNNLQPYITVYMWKRTA